MYLIRVKGSGNGDEYFKKFRGEFSAETTGERPEAKIFKTKFRANNAIKILKERFTECFGQINTFYIEKV